MPKLFPAIGNPRADWRHEVAACLRMAVPLAFAQIGMIGMEVTDAMMAGRLSGEALAAIGLGGSLAMPVMVSFMGICMAVSPMVAFHVGAGERERIAPYMAQTLWLALVLGVIWWLLYQTAPWIVGLVNVSPDLQDLTVAYVRAMAWGAPGACLMCMLRFMFEGLGKTGPVMVVGMIGLLANFLGNCVFMYGLLGLPALGAVGAGWGTALALWVMAVAMALFAVCSRHVRDLHLFAHLQWPRPRVWWQTLRLGLPVGVAMFLEVGLFGVLGLLMAIFSDKAVAAFQIAANFSALTFMLPLGIALATTARVGQAAGARDRVQARFRGTVGIVLALCSMIVPLLVMAIFPYWVARFYTHESDILILGAGLLQLAAVYQLFDGVQAAAAGALRGYKDTRMPMIITLVAYWVIGLPAGLWFGFVQHDGPRGLWAALIIGLGAASILLVWRFYRLSGRDITQVAAN